MQTLLWQKLRFLKFINSFFNPFWWKGKAEKLKERKDDKRVLAVDKALFQLFAWKERPFVALLFQLFHGLPIYSFTAYSFLLSYFLLSPFYFPPYHLLLPSLLLSTSLHTPYFLLLLSLLLPTFLLTPSLLITYSLLLLSLLLLSFLLTTSLLTPYYFSPYSFPTFSSNLSTSHFSCWAMVSCPLSSSMASSALRNGLTSRWLSL